VQNLQKEGIIKGVHRVGDVMYDGLLHNQKRSRERSNILARLDLQKGNYALATVHRAANSDNREQMSSILKAFGNLPLQVVFPVHPRTRKMFRESNLEVKPNTFLMGPVGPLDMLALQENADCILTDSGGVQKAAYMLGVRCLTLREETEWVETVEAGWNRLVGTDPQLIADAFFSWHPNGKRTGLYGEGHAAEQIRNVLSQASFND
jgi:UDP-N-acetylglucosamine 2-epimerase